MLIILLVAATIVQEVYLSRVRPERPDSVIGFVVPMSLNHGHLVYLSNMDATVRNAFFWSIGITSVVFFLLRFRSTRQKDGSQQ